MRDAARFDAFRRLLHQMYAMTGNLADAQEIVQETYARAWQRWSAFSSPAPSASACGRGQVARGRSAGDGVVLGLRRVRGQTEQRSFTYFGGRVRSGGVNKRVAGDEGVQMTLAGYASGTTR